MISHDLPDLKRLTNRVMLIRDLSSKDYSSADCADRRILVSAAPGNVFTATVHPSDVAVSRTRMNGISIRNRIPGLIVQVIERDQRASCVVDIGGVQLIAEVTRAALVELKVTEGANVVCLVKSRALSA